ncbi:MAG TPA: serine/threonine-protein kinase, partial [Gemmatimonadales bacterium]|nr:serine/threonine-protein kinase [Gemmatimonadales bacterium]
MDGNANPNPGRPLTGPGSDPAVASAFADRYRIERELGRGGMGAVYLARDIALDRSVALKVLPPEFASEGSLRERFLRETRMTASFSHPNIVPVYSVEERDGLLAFAMGYVEGESLAERVRRLGPVDTRTIVRVLQDIGYALAYAHGRGIVHRDIKPDNIMIERATGRALLMDFGISRAASATAGAAPGLTRVGEVVGTPEFMSPEQATGDEVDGRSDLYSLGLVALFALTGTAPITGSSVAQIITRQLTQLPPPAATLRDDIPDALGAAIDKCVAKQPEDRFQGAEALVEAIDAAQLAPPEIPLPIRMFAQELQSLGLIFFFLMVMAWLLMQNARQFGNLNVSLPVVVIVAVAVTRIVENYFTARRLGTFGFSADDVLKGFRGVVSEHEEHRNRLRADPATVRRRRSTVRRSLIQIPIAIALMVLAFRGRVKIGPGQYHVSALHVTLAISGLCLFGVSLVLLIRSPFRMQLNER